MPSARSHRSRSVPTRRSSSSRGPGATGARSWSGCRARAPPAAPAARLEQLARPGSDVRAILERLPLEGHLGVPRRSLQKLPQVLRKAPLAGDVELAVDVSGTARAAGGRA